MKAIKYRHLTLEQRAHIEELGSSGFSLRQIGRKLGISASTVCRELKRNSDKGYNHIQAQIISIARRHEASSRFKKIKEKVEERILECLRETWSPEQISGRLKLEGISISHEAIYQYVRKKDLRPTLRHGGKKYKAKKAKEAGVNCIPGCVDISERPSVVDEKLRLGDWEGDTVISHGSHCALMTLVDRRSKYTIIQKSGEKQQIILMLQR